MLSHNLSRQTLFKGVGRHMVGRSTNAIEYATGWLESQIVPSTAFSHGRKLFEEISKRLRWPREMITDNAGGFVGAEAQEYFKSRGIKICPVTPARPRGNGRVEQANGVLKYIMLHIRRD
ncbi:hypothetical protein CDD82_2581 [Ophiocordyceps australis]|uniref:Integrase catalytic domain-containing protein n=1 Tax=Ophiocordyceps australis TaxID=1399860 RepID=A0A2C5ZHD7_9HYPO|nr:hypothetical protein CDD82_2581 [Ophiocordyceps australis]